MRGHRGISSQGGKMPHPHRACCEGTGSCPFTWERQWRWSDLPESTGALKLNRKNGGAKRRSPGLFTLGVTSEEKGNLMRERDNGTVALASYWKEGHTSTEGEHSWCRRPFSSFLLKQDPVFLEKRAACRHRRRQLLSLTLVEGTLPQPPLLSFKLGHPRRTLTLQRDYQARRVMGGVQRGGGGGGSYHRCG